MTKALVGTVLPDPDLIEAALPATLAKIARAAPQLARLALAEPEWDIRTPLAQAVVLQARAHAEHEPIEDLLSQRDIFGAEPSPVAAALARALGYAPRQFQKAIADYAAAASHHASGQMLLGAQPETPREALLAVIGAPAALPPGGPTDLERSASLPKPAVWDPVGHALLVRDDSWAAISQARARTLAPLPEGSLAVALERRDIEALAGATLDSETRYALTTNPNGVAVVRHTGDAAMMRRARLEELMHLVQAAIDRGRASAALNPEQARAWLARWPGARRHIMTLYAPLLRSTLERGAARGFSGAQRRDAVRLQAAMEAGVRVLIGAYDELGLTEAEGNAAREELVRHMEASNGQDGIARGRAAAEAVGLGPVRRNGAGAGPGQPGAVGDAAGGGPAPVSPEAQPQHLGPRRQLDAVGGDHSPERAGEPEALIGAAAYRAEPERGPFAALFHTWDKLTEPVAAVGNKAYGMVSKYYGVSPKATEALRAWAGRRDFAELEKTRTAERLYQLARRELGAKTEAEALPHLRRVADALEQPGSVKLTPGEQAVAVAERRVLDAATLTDVVSGLLTPEALRGAEGMAAGVLGPEQRAELATALAAWRQLGAKFAPAGSTNPQAQIRAALLSMEPGRRARLRGSLARLPNGAGALVTSWIESASPGVLEPYFPHRYLEQPQRSRGPGTGKLSETHQNMRTRKHATLAEAEQSGLSPDPDSISAVVERLGRALQAASNRALFGDIGALGKSEFHPAAPAHGIEPEASPGFTLARDTALAGKGKAAIMGGPEPEVSERIARAIEDMVGPRNQRSLPARVGRAAWEIQRMVNFWNFLKHSYNVGALAAGRGAVEGSRALLTLRPRAAASELRVGLGPLSFLTDPQLLAQSLGRHGALYDRAV
ncbi:MAG: hypothetical protein ACRD1C_03725 [Terriglobales bacterium]